MKSLSLMILTLLLSLNVYAGLESIPVQDAGRIKPFDTFARESLALAWGKEKYKGKPATQVIMSWIMVPEEWDKNEFIQVRHSGLREALQLDKVRIYYSPTELITNDKLALMVQELRSKQEERVKLDPFFQALQRLENQISVYQGIRMGLAMNMVPAENDENNDKWLYLQKFEEPYKSGFQEILTAFATLAGAENSGDKGKIKEAKAEMDAKADAFVELIKKDFGDDYAPFSQIAAELHYNKAHPFMYSWIFYLLATILFGVVVFGGSGRYEKAAWICMLIGFLLHTYGFGLRVYITGRAPVTNMYETVVWVAWGAIICSVLLERFYKQKVLLPAAGVVATLSLILCDLSSHVLDGSLHPLEPVLRDNFWLLVHVLTITLSYATFFVAFILGDIILFMAWKDETKFKAQIASSAQAIYRCLQVGVVLLAAGTILGGVWADYSWGRFWGWDPKETWAFIALMGYLAILHGRIGGMLKNFGLAACSVLGFSLVIMAWYGVNFVLGAGLHTYGFGAGGVEYVSAFVAVHLLYVAFVTTVRQSRLKAEQS